MAVVDLTPDVLVIADEARVVALAGIMGGEGSGISDNTRHLFLECAFFSPLTITGKARRYGLHTDASHRYERGVDPRLQRRATERTTELLLDIVGGEAGPHFGGRRRSSRTDATLRYFESITHRAFAWTTD